MLKGVKLENQTQVEMAGQGVMPRLAKSKLPKGKVKRDLAL